MGTISVGKDSGSSETVRAIEVKSTQYQVRDIALLHDYPLPWSVSGSLPPEHVQNSSVTHIQAQVKTIVSTTQCTSNTLAE